MKICVVGTRGFPEIQGGVEKHCEALYTAMCTQHEIKIILSEESLISKSLHFIKTYIL